ncbi:LysR substrate-binding domain-containing protein [Marinobacterium rhizophilum]|uniref:LysR family transcriptional regulator n=1 Tax=Marinobacterium rhizophilum TaxID=420402 RepID=A0ABY5HN24_9GAMM|nr:LysR substrate-binding domain-containing protein [Marinobacterium rhizophilum]UTW12647.1 LysR family transcriptional regulator [Marinobacterium rhizophilum]
MKNLPTDLLRTFVTINDLGGFTQAGEVLGRSQPAVSLQVKRLEELVAVQLFNRAQGLRLTEEGQMLYGYARKILDLNDTAVSRLMTPAVSGSVRLGIPNDFEVSFLPMTLSKFSRAYPNVMLDVSSDLSVNLRRDYLRGAYDLVMSMDEHPSSQIPADEAIVEPLAWVSSPGFRLDAAEPVPLVLYPKGCVYRHHVTEALNEAGIAWRILYCTSSLLGIQSAIEAGLGVSALASNTVPGVLRADKTLGHLPSLGDVTIGFNYDATSLSAAAARLLEHLRQGLQQCQLYLPPKRV